MKNSIVIDKHGASNGEFTQRVMTLFDIMKRLVEKGKQGGVTYDDWSPLADLVAVEEFERVGPFHDAVDWRAYTALLSQWVNHSQGWNPVIKRITETPGLVYVQCEEMITNGDRVDPFYSLSLYEFNDAGKIRRIEVYMQQEAAAPH
jgi:hypothetical protein